MVSSDVTALVLSARPYLRTWAGVQVRVHQSLIASPEDFLRAKLKAVELVDTPYFFYLDDDDTLPDDYLSVLADCKAASSSVAYTDRSVLRDGRFTHVKGEPYSQAAHLKNYRLTHQLALFKTSDVLDVIPSLPQGNYYPELLLGWQVAKRSAAYVPRIGYVWRPRPTGMHKWPATSASQVVTAIWCRNNP